MPRLKRQTKNGAKKTRGERVAELRRYFGLSQGEFAVFFGREQPHISQWETGVRPAPLHDIATQFGVSIDWLDGLTDVMWSRQVDALKEHLAERLLALDESTKNEISSPACDHTDRIMAVCGLCQEIDETLCTDTYLAIILGIPVETFKSLRLTGKPLNKDHYSRLAKFSGLPIEWFETGDFSLLDDSRFIEYRSVIASAIAKGITPDRLALILEAMSK